MVIEEKKGKVYAAGYDIQQLIDEHRSLSTEWKQFINERIKSKKISYYDLLRLIKEDKQPQLVIYNKQVYEWDKMNYSRSNERGDYLSARINESESFKENIITIYL